MTYDAVMRLAKDKPEQLPLVDAAFALAPAYGNRFPGSAVFDRTGPLAPNLSGLAKRGVVAKDGDSTRGGNRAYYRVHDMPGVERALRELGRLP